MSYEIITAIKPNLPPGDYGLLIRLGDCQELSNLGLAGEFLADVLHDEALVASKPRVEAHDEALYASLHMQNVDGDELLARGSQLVSRGIARLALMPTVRAATIPYHELNPALGSLETSFGYGDDMTIAMDAALESLKLEQAASSDIEHELYQILHTEPSN